LAVAVIQQALDDLQGRTTTPMDRATARAFLQSSALDWWASVLDLNPKAVRERVFGRGNHDA